MQVSTPQVSGIMSGQASALPRDLGQLPPEARENVATQFEGVFVSMLLKQMRQSLEEGLFAGDKSDSYGALFDQHMGEQMSARGGLGIRELVLSQYGATHSKGAS